jgi:ATP-binding protein involved in chromosome partitioning
VPVLGIIENMSVHVCSALRPRRAHLRFRRRRAPGRGVRRALLGELPLDARIREEADGGRPTVVAEPDSARAQAYIEMARHAPPARWRRRASRSQHVFPKIVVERS